MITAILSQPSPNVFSGNPIVFDFNTSDDKLVIIDVKINNVKKSLSYNPFNNRLKFDISDLFNSFFKSNFAEENTGKILNAVNDFFVNVHVDIKDDNYSFEFRVYRGGISTRLFNQFKSRQGNTNIFSYRLNNPEKQFLFTTRTNTRNIELSEDELYPFIFINPHKTIKIVSFFGNEVSEETPDGSICSIDFESARRTFFINFNELPSFFVVYVDNKSVFSVTIKHQPVTSEKYVLLFQNSFGAFEKYSVTGKAQYTPNFEEKESYTVLSEFNYFDEFRDRLKLDNYIEVETGYKTAEELIFLIDLIQSREIYFLYKGVRERCFVQAENLNIPFILTKPTSAKLKIKLANSELFYSPDYVNQNVGGASALNNITEPGYPEINSDGFIKDNEISINID